MVYEQDKANISDVPNDNEKRQQVVVHPVKERTRQMSRLYLFLFNQKWLLVMAFFAFTWAVVGSQLLFPFYSNNHDEPVYILQAQALAQGKLFLPTPQFSNFFNDHFVINQGNRAIFKYTPVHAAFLALGELLFGSMRATLGFVAALNVILLYQLSREFYPQKRLAAVAAFFLIFSPLFLIQSATFLSYTTALLLHLAFAVLLLRGTRCHKPALLFGAGIVLGLAFFARPYDTILFAIPFGLYFVGFNLSKYKEYPRMFMQQGVWILFGFVPMFGLVLAYNHYTTGNPFFFPFWLWDARDTLGFGIRGRNAEIIYNIDAAWQALKHHLLLLNVWVFGGTILLGLALLKLISRRLHWPDLTLLLLIIIFPAGYLFFWGSYHAVLVGTIEYLGPWYYFPLLAPISILGAQGWLSLYLRRPRMAQILIALMLLISGGLLLWHIAQNRAYTRENQIIYRPFVEQQLDNALVFVPPLASGTFLLAPFSYLINTPTLDGPIIYALNLDHKNFALLDAYPERTPYRFDYSGPYTKTPHDNPKTALVKLERRQVDSFTQRLQITNPGHSPYVFVEVLNKGQAETYLLDDASAQGKQYEVEWTIGFDKVEFQGDYRQHLSSITGLSPTDKLVISVAFADDLERQTQQVYERRFTFRLTENNQLDILLPAETWYNFFWPVTGWLMGDIDEVMTDQ